MIALIGKNKRIYTFDIENIKLSNQTGTRNEFYTEVIFQLVGNKHELIFIRNFVKVIRNELLTIFVFVIAYIEVEN